MFYQLKLSVIRTSFRISKNDALLTLLLKDWHNCFINVYFRIIILLLLRYLLEST